MSNIKTLIAGTLFCGLSVAAISCSEKPSYRGTWESITPENELTSFPGATTATSRTSLTFGEATDDGAGDVELTNDYTIVRTAPTADGSRTLTLNIDAKGLVKGKWTPDVDDEDDLLLNFDHSTLEITIDGDKVTLASDTTGLAPERVDSLRTAVTDMVRQQLRTAMTASANLYSVISDVEVSKDGKTLGFETDHNDAKVRMQKKTEL